MRILHRLLVTLLACIAIAPLVHAIDFTPRYADTVEEGYPFHRMYFSEVGTRIYFRPPADWQASGEPSSVTFSLKDLKSNQVRLEVAPAEHAAIPLNEQGLQSLRAIAQSLIPAQSADAVEQWETVNPVIIHGWSSFEVGFCYQSKGRQFCRSVLFINLSPERQIHVIVESPAADFAKLYKAAHRSLSTWWEVQK